MFTQVVNFISIVLPWEVWNVSEKQLTSFSFHYRCNQKGIGISLDMSAVSKSTPVGHGLLSQLKTKVLKCFGYTTAHGYGRVADAESRLHRWFWLFVCAVALGTFTQQLYVITQQYMSKPLKTRTSIGHDEVNFLVTEFFNNKTDNVDKQNPVTDY